MRSFFPDLYFAWASLAVLFGLLAAASWTDQRRMTVSRWLSVALFGSGVLFNLIRGGWLGALGRPVWLSGGTVTSGLFDGLLFALAGFVVGFALFLVLWILGACGGGDVKMFAGLGAWLGPGLSLAVYVGTYLIVLVVVIGLGFYDLLNGRSIMPKRKANRKPDDLPTARRKLTYALPLTLATLTVALWAFRSDLHLAAARPIEERTQHDAPATGTARHEAPRQPDA